MPLTTAARPVVRVPVGVSATSDASVAAVRIRLMGADSMAARVGVSCLERCVFERNRIGDTEEQENEEKEATEKTGDGRGR
jgi:hypothetical protein